MKLSPFLLIAFVSFTNTAVIGVAAAQEPSLDAALPPALDAAALPTSAVVKKPPSGGDELTLKLSSHVALAPAEVIVQMRVAPDARSRALSVEWWTSDGVGGSHEVSLEGDRAALRQSYSIKRMEAGEYVVTAVVTRADGSKVVRSSHVIVVSKGDSEALADAGAGDLISATPRPRGR